LWSKREREKVVRDWSGKSREASEKCCQLSDRVVSSGSTYAFLFSSSQQEWSKFCLIILGNWLYLVEVPLGTSGGTDI
jgi:hypothetical protein